MRKWWIGAALAAMCVGQSAWGQYPPAGGGPLPDPVPEAPCAVPGPKFMPGPLTGDAAPPGPGDALSLPADVPTAWGRGGIPESGLYLSLGGMGLMRERPGSGAIASNHFSEVLTTHDLDPDFHWGGRATVGYLCDDAAIELTGFYTPEQTTTVGVTGLGQMAGSVTTMGQLQLSFFNPPAGFLGPAGSGVWNNADRAVISLRDALGSAELNYRWWSRSTTEIEGIVGVRYFDLQERASIFADDSLSLGIGGTPAEQFQATYTANVHNHIVLAQTGFEWNMPLRSWLNLGLIAKAGFGGNDVRWTTKLARPDGVVAFSWRSNEEWTYTSVYEVDAFLDIVTLEKMRVRVGYTALWLLHVGEAFQQIDYNLASQPGAVRDGGSVFYHGPMVEVQFLF